MRRSLLLALLAACGNGNPPAPTPTPTPTPATVADASAPATTPATSTRTGPMTLADSGIVGAWIDKAADPCVDFFQYACGAFVKTAVIPPDRSSWGSIQIVNKEIEDFLKKVLEDAAAARDRDATTTKLGDYFASCMDEPTIEQVGTTPIRPLLQIVASAKDPKTTAAAVIALHGAGVFPFFALGPQQDFVDATKVIAGIDQGGLGLPDRAYYLEDKGTMPRTRGVYLKHIERMISLLGVTPPAAKTAAADIMRIETAIAKLSQDKVTRRDPHKIYHRVERAGLEKLAPSFPWGDYLTALGIPGVTEISVNSPEYFTGIAKLLETETPAALQAYLEWTVLRATANDLGKSFIAERFTMQHELSGVKELPPRWRTCVNHVDGDLGELLGQSYVKARFAGDSKPRAVDLTKAIFAAMKVTLDTLPWMDDATRTPAQTKLEKMAYLIGYPDTWRAYPFDIKRGDFFGNVRAATHFELARQYTKIGKPVDRSDWQMTPPTVNAYYDSSLNQIVLPAGQLQPPFFGAGFHPAVNFGSTGGGTIGHELTHGFDDEGSQFDASGNLRDWWSKVTKDKFAVATKCVVDQYAAYEAVPKVKLDGKLTAGENIADIGGVKLGFQAYQLWRAAQKQPVQAKIDEYSDDQLYFLAYGQSWCETMTEEALQTMAHSNPHSPPKWRVNGVIVNQPGFGTAFKCAAKTPMNPGTQCSVW